MSLIHAKLALKITVFSVAVIISLGVFALTLAFLYRASATVPARCNIGSCHLVTIPQAGRWDVALMKQLNDFDRSRIRAPDNRSSTWTVEITRHRFNLGALQLRSGIWVSDTDATAFWGVFIQDWFVLLLTGWPLYWLGWKKRANIPWF